jgi:hypothetical protein
MSRSSRGDGPGEVVVKRIWQSRLLEERGLVTSGGEQIEVVYPGRPNNDRGPDFRSAIIVIGRGEPIKGDIEVHVRSSQWQAHGHHRDPGYNGVILHVVMWDYSERPTPLENGGFAPVLALHHWFKGSADDLYRRPYRPLLCGVPCHEAMSRLGIEALGKLLDEVGEGRFQAKVGLFRGELASEEKGQVLYRGIMGALGYSKNKLPFQELSRRLPLRLLEGFARDKTPREYNLTLQALLFGTAGLLPCQGSGGGEGEGLVRELEEIWRKRGSDEVMTLADWTFFRVRPENFPTHRLAAMSYLLARCKEGGLFQEMLRAARGASARAGLEKGLMVKSDGYWDSRFDFGVVRRWRNPTLLGQGKAAEIVVNVILPFMAALGEPDLKEKAREVYRGYRKLAENEITRRMRLRLFPQGDLQVINTARRQQGLIHIYKGFCAEGRCTRCPLQAPLSKSSALVEIDE